MTIHTEAPIWLSPLCLLIGLVYAGALYFYDRFNRTYGWKLAAVLGTMRFVVVSIIAFFLLKPLIKTISRTVEKPIVLVAQDNSQSIAIGADSAFYKNQYPQLLRDALKPLEEDYDVQFVSFGANVHDGIDSLNYSEQLTDYSTLLNDVYNRFSGRNLGALVVATDGIYNKGSNPVYDAKKLNVPVFTIALGDTTIRRDILVAEANANRLAYLGNQFPLQIVVEGRQAKGENAVLTVTRGGNTLYSEQVIFDQDRYFKTINLTLPASEVGLQRYSIQLTQIANEVTVVNNHKDVFIDVLDSREKILILAQAPHPDVAALREAIGSNENYKVESMLAKNFQGNVSEYSMIVFHQLPAIGGLGANAIAQAMERSIPSLFVWGASTDFGAFNKLNTGFALNNYRNSATDIGARLAENFSLFELSPQTESMFGTMPPLSVPFGDYIYSTGATPLLVYQLGNLKSAKPLIGFNKMGDKSRVGLISGEGIWRWRNSAFAQFNSHDAFNELVTKTTQYLSAKEDKSLFRVNSEHDFLENENVVFTAELYNQALEAITSRDISMVITDEQGQAYNYTFSTQGTSYRLDAGRLAPGHYRYEAQAGTDQGVLKEKGEFSVSPLQLEETNTIADHHLLQQFARENNGAMLLPQQLNELANLIKNQKEIVAVSYENKQLDDLIQYRWLLALLILLLGGEWLLRKRAGTY